MSEDDVQDMMEANEFIEEQYEDEDDDGYTVTGCDPDEYDGQPDEAQEWADFDADC